MTRTNSESNDVALRKELKEIADDLESIRFQAVGLVQRAPGNLLIAASTLLSNVAALESRVTRLAHEDFEDDYKFINRSNND